MGYRIVISRMGGACSNRSFMCSVRGPFKNGWLHELGARWVFERNGHTSRTCTHSFTKVSSISDEMNL